MARGATKRLDRQFFPSEKLPLLGHSTACVPLALPSMLYHMVPTSLPCGPRVGEGGGLRKEMQEYLSYVLCGIPEGQDSVLVAAHHHNWSPGYHRVLDDLLHLPAHGGRAVVYRRMGHRQARGLTLLPDGGRVTMEDEADCWISVVKDAMCHGLRGRLNRPEALDSVPIGVIPGDHAEVARGQGRPSSGLGAGDEGGPRAGWPREGR